MYYIHPVQTPKRRKLQFIVSTAKMDRGEITRVFTAVCCKHAIPGAALCVLSATGISSVESLYLSYGVQCQCASEEERV